jgi:hypothetical protein
VSRRDALLRVIVSLLFARSAPFLPSGFPHKRFHALENPAAAFPSLGKNRAKISKAWKSFREIRLRQGYGGQVFPMPGKTTGSTFQSLENI